MKNFINLFSRIKRFKQGFLKKGGRNSEGKITVYHRGGGLKRNYRVIDYWRRINQQGVVLQLITDPFRNCFIALVLYNNGLLSYILAAEGLLLGQFVWSGSNWIHSDLQSLDIWPWNVRGQMPLGSTILLGVCPIGTEICNIEIKPGFGGQICRAAGTSAVIVKKDTKTNTVLLKLKSGWFFRISSDCLATVGIMSNVQYKFFIKKKAGFNRNFGKRPVVRGVAMNPIDHPHGGGEGKASGGKRPKTPWGWGTKGRRTVSKKNRRQKIVFRFKS